MRIVQAGSAIADVREGNVLRKGGWGMDASVRPDVFEAFIEGPAKRIAFITDRDSVVLNVEPGKTYPFVFLLNGKDSAFTEVRGIKWVQRAQFPTDYQRAHRGKTTVEVPPMYELLNVVFALTEKGREKNSLINRDTDYYREVMTRFEPYRNDPAVKKMQEALMSGDGSYSALKMDAYAFELSQDGTIARSRVYDRIGNSNTNFLHPYIADLQKFAVASRFQEFYHTHKPFYEGLTQAYRDSIGVSQMQRWLVKNFPSTRYDSFKIIFSPLVAGNQSASFFEHNGFREAQAHVNFPFHTPQNVAGWSPEALRVKDGNIVFTELNHAFIGPEGQKPAYRDRIQKALSNLDIWNDPQKPAHGYNTPQMSFDEYMNWALVSLRYIDYAPLAEQPKLIAQIEDIMLNHRGFRRFPEFNQFLVKTYKNRRKRETVADLYPAIVGWFEENK